MKGLGKADRERLSAVLRGTKGTISVAEAAEILGMPSTGAAKLLSRWATKGWLSRVRRGLYISVPLESRTADIPLEDAWIIADKLYGPCYIGGWSAAEYWDLTEQIFRTVIVLTTQRPRDRKPIIKGTEFLVRSVSAKAMFGLKAVWRGQVKVNVSDPTRTVLDMLNDPQLGGGLRSTIDMFRNYMSPEKKDLGLLIKYANQLGNGAVFKRLGFLLEKYAENEQDFIEQCRESLTTGNAKFDPSLKAEKLITRWRLWVPGNVLIDRQEVMDFAREFGLAAQVIEKDYTLGWLLAGIAAHSEIGQSWIFKGGTCLKKCYFETYRFSEDLDFTLTNPDHLREDFLLETFNQIASWVYDNTGIEIPADTIWFEIYENLRNNTLPADVKGDIYEGLLEAAS